MIFDAAQGGREPLRVAVLVAHPDDEVLWAGGLLLGRPWWSVFIATLCRKGDSERAGRFRQALTWLQAEGAMGAMDDGPDQNPLPDDQVQETLLALLSKGPFDLILTHAPDGEYTYHLRHQEVARGVAALVRRGALVTREHWQFAYADHGGAGLPEARPDASFLLPLEDALWARKYALITEVYSFRPDSWEARSTPRIEGFTLHPNEVTCP